MTKKIRKISMNNLLNKYSANAKELWRDWQRKVHLWDDEYMNDDAYADYIDHEYELYKDRMLFGW